MKEIRIIDLPSRIHYDLLELDITSIFFKSKPLIEQYFSKTYNVDVEVKTYSFHYHDLKWFHYLVHFEKESDYTWVLLKSS